MNMWEPLEIIVNKKIKNDPTAKEIRKGCSGVPAREVDNGLRKTIVGASRILRDVKKRNLNCGESPSEDSLVN